MGQYYVPIVLDEDGKIEHHMSSWDFDSGLKLMEHSWLGNRFVAAFESLLAQEAPRRVVWAGDYADPEVDEDGIVVRGHYTTNECVTKFFDANLQSMCDDDKTLYRPPLPGLGRKSKYQWRPEEQGGPIVRKVKDPDIQPNVESAIRVTQTSHPFILNWDKKEFVDKRKVRRATYTWDKGKKWAIHPLPLLTVEGNGRGGGDFHVDESHFQPGGYLSDRKGPQGNISLIGRWARDHISVSSKPPQNDGWTEIVFDLVEMGTV